MKALSICQPWSWAILNCGKSIENRSWPTRHRGPLLVHAGLSKEWYADVAEWWPEAAAESGLPPLPAWGDLVKGAIVGVVDVIGCVHADEYEGNSPWAGDEWLWLLADPRILVTPVPYRGALSLFEVPDASIWPAQAKPRARM